MVIDDPAIGRTTNAGDDYLHRPQNASAMSFRLNLDAFSRKLAWRCVAVPVVLGSGLALLSTPVISGFWLRIAAGMDILVLAALCLMLDRLVPASGGDGPADL